MSSEVYQYSFKTAVPMHDVKESLLLAILATESLHGAAQTRLDVDHHFDADQFSCVIDAATQVGRDLNRLFIGFLQREFGHSSFTVVRNFKTTAAA